MSSLMYLILAVGWVIVGVINIRHGAHWSFVALDAVLAAGCVFLGVRKAIRSGQDDDEDMKKK